MTAKNILIFWICRFVYLFIKSFYFGAGSTWPGHIALGLNPKFIEEVLADSPTKIVLVVGTNGKTTTAKLLTFILEKNSISVSVNDEGANLLNGIASTIIKRGTKSNVLILEIDENTLPLILRKIKPSAIIILNLFRDQLDRYGEVNTIAVKWHESLKKLSHDTMVFINGDDPRLAFIGQDLPARTFFFGLPEECMGKKEVPHDVDSVYCPRCGAMLAYSTMSYSHLGNYYCKSCQFKRPLIYSFKDFKLTASLAGLYNRYNIYGVVLMATIGFGIPIGTSFAILQNFVPAFGRQETISYKGRNIFILLSKNPTGFNQSIETVIGLPGSRKNTLILLNDRIPDGRDVSWIWDVDFEKLARHSESITVSGDRPYDMALRIKYCFDDRKTVKNVLRVKERLPDALLSAIDQTPPKKILYILATYSAMLEVRKIIFGRSLL